MSTSLVSIEKNLIRIPGSPFWNVFKDFGKDEMIALVIGFTGTWFASRYLTSSPILLMFVSPLLEKIGFFARHSFNAYVLYRNTAATHRVALLYYVKRALKDGSGNLVKDIALHDPCYLIMFFGLSLAYPGVPELNAIVSFLAGIAFVAVVDTHRVELNFLGFKRRLKSLGFGTDEYFEARFFTRARVDRESILQKLQTGLQLYVLDTLEYRDTYYDCSLREFSGRDPYVRYRERTLTEHDTEWTEVPEIRDSALMRTWQIIYTRPQEEISSEANQWRCFVVSKGKFYYMLREEALEKNTAVSKVLGTLSRRKDVASRRIAMRDIATDDLLVAVDVPLSEDAPGCMIEVKIRKRSPLFLAAMHFVMLEFPFLHTTRGKIELDLF